MSAAFIKELMRRSLQFHLERVEPGSGKRDSAGEITRADVEQALDELLVSGGSLNRMLLGGNFGESEVNQETSCEV